MRRQRPESKDAVVAVQEKRRCGGCSRFVRLLLLQQVTTILFLSLSSSSSSSSSSSCNTCHALVPQQPPAPQSSSSSSSSSSLPFVFSNNHKQASSKSIPIVACASTVELQRALSYYIQPGDNVLELGARFGQESAHLCDLVVVGRTGHATLWSIQQQQQPAAAKSGRNAKRNDVAFQSGGMYADVCTLVQVTSLKECRQALLLSTENSANNKNCYNVCVMDLAAMVGNDLHLTALNLAMELADSAAATAAFSNCRVIIIKSKALASLARRLVNVQHLKFQPPRLAMDKNSNNKNSNFDSPLLQHESDMDDESSVTTTPSSSSLLTNNSNNNNNNEPWIVTSVGVEEYRWAIPFAVRPGDAVLEIGCHAGTTTRLVHYVASASAAAAVSASGSTTTKNAGFCIGVDIGPNIIDLARKQNPGVPFAVKDGFNMLELLRVKMELFPTTHGCAAAAAADQQHNGLISGYDVVFVDIGGLSGPDGILESLALLESIRQCLQPRVIVMKSLCMKRLTSRLLAFSNVWQQQQQQQQTIQ